MSIEIYIGTITDNKEKGLGKWSPIYNELKDLWNMNCIYNIYCIFFKQFIYLYNLSCLWCNKMIKEFIRQHALESVPPYLLPVSCKRAEIYSLLNFES